MSFEQVQEKQGLDRFLPPTIKAPPPTAERRGKIRENCMGFSFLTPATFAIYVFAYFLCKICANLFYWLLPALFYRQGLKEGATGGVFTITGRWKLAVRYTQDCS
jgi:hypothetical protein